MRRLHWMRWLIVVVCAWHGAVASAQSRTTVDIDAQVGFANSYAVARLTPVVLTVTGDTRDRDVRLEWAVTANRGTTVTWYHDMTLPANSRKQVTFYTTMPGYARSIVARVRDAQGILRSTMIDAEPVADMLDVVVSDDTNLLADLAQAAVTHNTSLVMRTITPRQLPSDVAGFHGIYTLFLADPNQLSPAQSDAVRTWLALGGRVVLGGRVTGTWRDIAAIEPSDTPLDPALLPAEWPQTRTVPHARILTDATPVRGHETLMWQRNIGRGDVFHTVLPLDATRGWAEQFWYWEPVIETSYPLTISPAAFPAGVDGNDVLANGLAIPSSAPLAPLTVFVIMVVYIIIIAPLTYLVLKRRKQLDSAWVSIPVTALVVTVMLVVSNWIIRGNTTLVYKLVVIHQDDTTPSALATSSLAIFSPVRQDITITADTATTFIELAAQPTHALAQHDTQGTQVSYTSDIGDLNYFMGITSIPRAVDITHTLRYQNDTLTGTVTFRGKSFDNVVVVSDSFSHHLGMVPADVPVAVQIDSNQNPQFPCAETNETNSVFRLQQIYTQIAGPCGATDTLPRNRVTIYAWSRVDAPSPTVTGLPVTDQRQLLIITLHVPTTP